MNLTQKIFKRTPKEFAADVIVDIIAGLFIGFATYNFTVAYELPVSGASGIALIFYHLFGLPIGAMTLAFNVPVILLCFKFLGYDYFFRSAKSLLIMSFLIDNVCNLFPVFRGNELVAVALSGISGGIGYALLFLRDSSTCGTDFLILTVQKFKPALTIGTLSIIFDGGTILLNTLCVARNLKIMFYGIIMTFIIAKVIDLVMLGPLSKLKVQR